MAYELKQSDIHGLAERIGAETRIKGRELFFKWCPYCGGGGHDRETFSINLENGMFKCFREKCGKQGHFVQMARDFGYPLEQSLTFRKKRYRSLPQRTIEVRAPAVDYLASRGISRETVERYHITTQKGRDNILVFPFYSPEGTLQFVKYRKTDFDKSRDTCKEWCEKNTMPILFGMDQCEDFETLVITEGQIDSLTLAHCGIKNSVSVPTGAKGFSWLENCWDWIIKFREIVVFGDCEDGKITLIDELSKRLSMPVKVVRVDDYFGEKDANDILRQYGIEAVRYAVEHAQIQPVSHVKELADVEAVDLNSLDHIETGIREIDRIIGGFYFGQVVLLTGKRGEGKSTFMSQLIVEAIQQDYKVLAYSGELVDYHFKRWIDFQTAGPDHVVTNVNTFGEEIYLLTNETVRKISEWYRGKAYLYDNNALEDEEFEGLLHTVEQAVCRYGIRFVCLDNLMTALDVDLKDDLYRAQSKFMKKLKQLAVKYNIVILVVAHPRKSSGSTDNDDVSGSSDITNRVDVVLWYSRCNEEDCDSKLEVLKNRLTGKLTRKRQEIKLFYSQSTKRITSFESNRKVYGWETQDFEEVDIKDEDLPF